MEDEFDPTDEDFRDPPRCPLGCLLSPEDCEVAFREQVCPRCGAEGR